ncbi:sensor histidine kinase [Propionibacteriaceae bacterium Y2011]
MVGSRSVMMLRMIIIVLHVSMVVLVLLAGARFMLTPDHDGWRLAVGIFDGLAILGAYLFGMAPATRDPARVVTARVWLGVVVLLWVLGLVITADYAWVAFPLFFWHLQLLRRRHAIVAIAVMTVVVVLAPVVHQRPLEVGSVLGPVIGALFALGAGMVFAVMSTELEQHREALAELARTRGELAAAQHEAGRTSERERLSREIHDTLSQGFSSIVLLSRAADTALRAPTDLDRAATLVGQVEQVAGDGLAEARRFVSELAPVALESGLDAALQQVADRAIEQARVSGRELSVMINNGAADLPDPLATVVLRATQVATSNAVRHARAETVVITVDRTDDAVLLDVHDDGRGYEPQRTPYGFGLSGLQRRLAAVGGTLTVQSAPGEGTLVSVQAPLTTANEGDDDHE